jgi:hypothetical protein
MFTRASTQTSSVIIDTCLVLSSNPAGNGARGVAETSRDTHVTISVTKTTSRTNLDKDSISGNKKKKVTDNVIKKETVS